MTFDLKAQPASISSAICGLRRIIIVFSSLTNKMEMEITLDIKQCPMYMALKNSLVETFSNNFPKLINNSSNLNNVNHKCDGVCKSDINWYRCCNFNSPFSLVSVSVEKIGVLVCMVCQTPKTTFNHISNTSNFAKYFPFCL